MGQWCTPRYELDNVSEKYRCDYTVSGRDVRSRIRIGGRKREHIGRSVFYYPPYQCETKKAMYQATKGVNTHKGMIFSMGIICAAYGYCKGKNRHTQKITIDTIVDTAKKMTGRILAEELKNLEYPGKNAPQTSGERLLGGIR